MSLITEKTRFILPRTLFGRAILLIVVPLVLVELVTAYVFLDRHLENITRTLAGNIAGDVAVLAQIQSDSGDAAAQQLAGHMHIELHKGKIQKEIPNAEYEWANQILAKELQAKFKNAYMIQSDQRAVYVTVTLSNKQKATYRIGRKRLFSQAVPRMMLWILAASILVSVIAAVFMRNQVRAIQRLANAAENFGKGIETPGFRPQGATEVRRAGAAFLEMRDRIQRQVTQRMEMLAGISHDLRTPLTRMKLECAMLTDKEAALHLQGDLKEMESMVEGFLDFARDNQQEPVELNDMVVLIHEIMRQNTPFPIVYVGPDVVKVQARSLGVRRCLANLVSNAIRHGDHIKIGLKQTTVETILTVEDDGPGIPEDKRETVLRPFIRLDSSRNRQTGGVGLGLSIVQDIVHTHGGVLRLGASSLGGLLVEIHLPR